MPTDTKTAWLMTAERAARTRGFDGFSYADLAESVGIRKASVHHHFPRKAALSVALMHRYQADKEAACARVDAAEPTGGARLGTYQPLSRGFRWWQKPLPLCVVFHEPRKPSFRSHRANRSLSDDDDRLVGSHVCSGQM